uniref:Uncharacterized protein n=1 Tax=Anguilla anguilla TaxID=7936 RepID=A0A0E9XR26_ANGAN
MTFFDALNNHKSQVRVQRIG